MNFKKQSITIELLNQVMYFYVTFCFVCPFLYYVEQTPSCLPRLLCLLPFSLLSYGIRLYSKHIWSFFAGHLVLCGLTFLIPHTIVELGFSLVYVVILCMVQLNASLKKDPFFKSNASPLLLLPVLIGYFLCEHFCFTATRPYYYVGTILCCVLFCINSYLIHFFEYIRNSETQTSIPYEQISMIGRTFITCFSFISIVIMIGFSKLPYQGILKGIQSFLLNILRSILEFLNPGSEPAKPKPVKPLHQSPAITDLLGKPKKPNIILVILEKLIFYGLYIAMVVGIITLICFTIYQIYKKFYLTKADDKTDKKEFLSPFDKKETLAKHDSTGKQKKLHKLFFFQSNNERIRAHFYREIQSNTNEETLNHYTSSELVHLASAPKAGLLQKNTVTDHKAANEMHALYDKARYGNGECSKDEVKKMNHLNLGS